MAPRVERRTVDRYSKSEVVRLVDDFGAVVLLQQSIVPGDLTMRNEQGQPLHGHRETDAEGITRIVVDTAEAPTDPVLYYTMEELVMMHEANIDNLLFDMHQRQQGATEFARLLGHTDVLPENQPIAVQAEPVTVAAAVPQLVEDPMEGYKGCCG